MRQDIQNVCFIMNIFKLKINLFDNPYKEMGTDSQLSKRQATIDEPAMRQESERRGSVFISESQRSLLGLITAQEPYIQRGNQTIKNAPSKQVKRKSLIPDRRVAEAEDTIMFDAAQEIKQFGHLMVMNVDEAQGHA